MKNAASRPGHVIAFFIHNFKQPSFRILAAQCVRGLPVPREPARGVERREARLLEYHRGQAEALKNIMPQHPDARVFDLRSPDRVVVGAPVQSNTKSEPRG